MNVSKVVTFGNSDFVELTALSDPKYSWISPSSLDERRLKAGYWTVSPADIGLNPAQVGMGSTKYILLEEGLNLLDPQHRAAARATLKPHSSSTASLDPTNIRGLTQDDLYATILELKQQNSQLLAQNEKLQQALESRDNQSRVEGIQAFADAFRNTAAASAENNVVIAYGEPMGSLSPSVTTPMMLSPKHTPSIMSPTIVSPSATMFNRKARKALPGVPLSEAKADPGGAPTPEHSSDHGADMDCQKGFGMNRGLGLPDASTIPTVDCRGNLPRLDTSADGVSSPAIATPMVVTPKNGSPRIVSPMIDATILNTGKGLTVAVHGEATGGFGSGGVWSGGTEWNASASPDLPQLALVSPDSASESRQRRGSDSPDVLTPQMWTLRTKGRKDIISPMIIAPGDEVPDALVSSASTTAGAAADVTPDRPMKYKVQSSHYTSSSTHIVYGRRESVPGSARSACGVAEDGRPETETFALYSGVMDSTGETSPNIISPMILPDHATTTNIVSPMLVVDGKPRSTRSDASSSLIDSDREVWPGGTQWNAESKSPQLPCLTPPGEEQDSTGSRSAFPSEDDAAGGRATKSRRPAPVTTGDVSPILLSPVQSPTGTGGSNAEADRDFFREAGDDIAVQRRSKAFQKAYGMAVPGEGVTGAALVPRWPKATPARPLIYAAAECPPIGNRHAPFDRAATPLGDLKAGIAMEGQAFLEAHAEYAAWLQQRDREGAEEGHFSPAGVVQRLTTAWDRGADQALFREAVFLWTAHSFLPQALDAAARTRDALKPHLVPCLRLLHCALQAQPVGQRHCGPVYRSERLTEGQQALFAPHKDPTVDFFTFDGFVRANTSVQAEVDELAATEKNAFFVFRPADGSDTNCCPVRLAELSADPQETKTLYPLGQQFQLLKAEHQPFKQLCLSLALVPPDCETASGSVFVVELRAVDSFWDLADDLYAETSAVVEAQPILVQRLDADLRLYGPDHLKVAAGYHQLGKQLIAMAEYNNALEVHQKLLETHITDPGVESRCDPQNDVADVFFKGLYDTVLKLYKTALQTRITRLGNSHRDVAASYEAIAIMYFSKKDYDIALELHRYALDIYIAAQDNRPVSLGGAETARGLVDPNLGATYENMANAYYCKGEYATASEMYEKALAIHVGALGASHPTVGDTYNNMANVHYSKADYEPALELYQQALDVHLAALDKNHPKIGATYKNMGNVYFCKGDYEAALQMYRSALDIRIAAMGPNHIKVADIYSSMAIVCNCQRDYDAALDMHEKVLEIRIAALGETHLSVADTYNSMANVCYSKGDSEGALAMSQKELGILCTALGNDHPRVRTLCETMSQSSATGKAAKWWSKSGDRSRKASESGKAKDNGGRSRKTVDTMERKSGGKWKVRVEEVRSHFPLLFSARTKSPVLVPFKPPPQFVQPAITPF